MSRTDAHTPLWVIRSGPQWRRDFHEVHNHETGSCTMRPDGDFHRVGEGTGCYREYNGGNRYCGCWMCTDQPGRKLARRQERVAWRRHRAVILAILDRSDVDVPPLRGSGW